MHAFFGGRAFFAFFIQGENTAEMTQKLSKTQWCIKKLAVTECGERIYDEQGRSQCSLCPKWFLVTEDRQYQVIEKHLSTVHGEAYDAYSQKCDENARNANRAVWANVRQKRSRDEHEDDVFTRWVVRHGVPYSAFDDPDWKIIFDGGTAMAANSDRIRANIVSCAAREKEKITAKFKNRDYTLAIDGGTTHNRSVLAIVGLLRGLDGTTAAYPIMSVHKEDDAAATIGTMVRQAIAMLPTATCISIVSDNHAPTRCATSAVCREVNAFPVRCYVHCAQLEIKRHFISLPDVFDALELAKKHESYRAPVPTRWWGVQETLETVEKKASKEDLVLLLAIRKVLPTMIALRTFGRIMEEDACTIPSAMRLMYEMRSAQRWCTNKMSPASRKNSQMS